MVRREAERARPGPKLATATPSAELASTLAAEMPALAGRGLEAPRFHHTGWAPRQCFTAADDPDRARDPWEPPPFVRAAGSAARPTCVEELPVAVGRFGREGSFARVVRGVLSEEECAAIIAGVNAKGFTPALLNIGGGRQEFVPGARDGHRVIVDSPPLTEWPFRALRPYLPEEIEDGSRLVELNERCRVLCYTPGQQFPAHYDGCFERGAGHPRAGDFSFVTVQLYLHSVPEEHGGATAFMVDGRPMHQPEAGSALLFTQDLPHEGSLVAKGIKYTLRTEAMYSRA